MIERADDFTGSEFSATPGLFGFYSAMLATLITFVTFGFAMIAVSILFRRHLKAKQ